MGVITIEYKAINNNCFTYVIFCNYDTLTSVTWPVGRTVTGGGGGVSGRGSEADEIKKNILEASEARSGRQGALALKDVGTTSLTKKRYLRCSTEYAIASLCQSAVLQCLI